MINSDSSIYIPGEEWLYYKIYCGFHTSDVIIADIINPIASHLINENLIDKWFFVRYYDTDYHLRIRLHLNSTNFYTKVFSIVNHYLKPMMINGLVSSILIDTYERETKRYGNDNMDLAETIFFHDSVCTATATSTFLGNDNQYRRALFSFCSIDAFLDNFCLRDKDKSSFVSYMSKSFYEEIGMNHHLSVQLNKKYREYKPILDKILYQKDYQDDVWRNALQKRATDIVLSTSHIIKGARNSEDVLKQYLWSYLHMLNNRIFRSQQRTNELVVYYYMAKHYNSLLHRS